MLNQFQSFPHRRTAMRHLSVLLALLALTGTLLAQAPVPQRDKVGTGLTTPPDVQYLSGENIGIRIVNGPTRYMSGPNAQKMGPVQGSIVVKIGGQWVDVVLSPNSVGEAK
jgi:hypothetical protein